MLLVAAFAVSTVAVGGCGADHRRSSASTRPTLPHAIALRLAADSDEIARKLAAGDDCRARSAAIRLRQQTIREINAGRIPAAFQEPLQSTANDLATRIRCVVPTPLTPRAEPVPAARGHGHANRGRHKGRGKHDDKQKGEGD